MFKPEAYLVNVVCLQQHFPQQTEEQRGRALHGEVSDDVILVGHRLPLPVLLFHVLLQVETRLLGNVVLLKERLAGREEERGTFISIRVEIWHLSSRLSDCSVPVVEQGSRTACVRPSCEVWSSLWSGGCLYTRSHGWSLSLWKNLQTKHRNSEGHRD